MTMPSKENKDEVLYALYILTCKKTINVILV